MISGKSAATARGREDAFRLSLSAVPARNSAARVIPSASQDELEVEVRLRYEGAVMAFLRKIFRLADRKTYLLDKIGRRVYESIDGEKTFGELIDEFAASQKLTFFESRALLGQYMGMLAKRGLIAAAFQK